MAAGAFVPLIIFVLVVGTVGFRLLALSRRTAQTPERLLGLGLVGMSCIAIPLAGIGRVPALIDSVLGKTSFALGMISIGISAALLVAFTQHVFRPGVRWAMAARVALSLLFIGAVAWMGYVNFVGSGVDAIVARMRPGTLTLMVCLLLCFAWASVESFSYHANLKRRLALGLSDPVLVDRFLLWGVSSAANSLLVLVLIHCVRSGMVILHNPIPLTAIAVLGSVMSAAWYLTFLAPESYLRHVRERATRS